MRRSGFFCLATLVCGLAATLAEAVVYVPVTDASLVDRSPIAIIGVVQVEDSSGPADTAYQVWVERVLKGAVPGREIRVMIPGSDHFVAPGMPRPAPGERWIFFIAPQPNGSYRLVELMLGAFREVRVKDSPETRAVRELAGSLAIGRAPTEPARDFNEFAEWIQSRGQGVSEGGSYERPVAPLAIAPRAEFAPYTFLGSPARWAQFDDGVTVPWVIGPGSTTLASGGATALQAALNAFNNEPNSNLAFTYAGTNSGALGLSGTDGLHALLMNDPFNEIEGTYNCSQGGILARGGFSTTGTTHTHKGSSHRTIREGAMVTQDGSDCVLGLFSGAFGAQVIAHELGHAVGLGHSCGDAASGACVSGTPQEAALMKASASASNRGATFSSDDVAGLVRLYEMPIPPSVTIAAARASEGHTGQTLIGFTATLSTASSSVITVLYSTSAGTATAGADYVTRSGTLTFAAGQTSRPVLVAMVSDAVSEPDETFSVTLSGPSGATLGTAVAVGTIVNDDVPVASFLVNQYRLYSPITLEHLYTTDLNEYNVLGTQVGSWNQEGVGYRMLSSAGPYNSVLPSPFYRLYHTPSRQHHWTTEINEVMVLGALTDWNYEGISGYLLPSQVALSIPLYRLLYPNPVIHLWTTDANERTILTSLRGWIAEGIAGYVVP